MNAATAESSLAGHPVVSAERWLAERRRLLEREKELTRLHDQVARERRALPWRRVEQDYVFDTPQGRCNLGALFGARSQLLVQHFMFAPGWEQGCKSCSYMADHNDGAIAHLAQRDVAFVAVSRAPLEQIERFRRRMGWRFAWVSSYGNAFNRDFGVNFAVDDLSAGQVDYNYVRQPFPHEEAPGISVFHRDPSGAVFHTYSRYGRGVEVMMHTYQLLDLTPKGRDEDGLEYSMAWVRHHDRYPADAASLAASGCCGSHD
ncbi:thioredoxin family protein [Lysobacter firmicutimachus]|uniref:Thioredoxin family protein n=1 Tax=Lysobacter firmicutimachus TaxID=1792846 RepID=A0AAU8MZX5_9GAMM